MSDDPFDLQRFLKAQQPVFDTALAELRAARKRTHWMWFIFPQMRGLGLSPTAVAYGVGSLAEARAYIDHSLLGSRLLLCTQAVLATTEPSLAAIFGSPDDMKFLSSMTLFAEAAPSQEEYRHALARFCGGRPDERTLALLGSADV